MNGLHRHTPALQVIDPRGLALRTVTYYRASLAESLQTRVARASYDAAGRLVWQWDPRLGAQPDANANDVTTYSLSATALRTESVDAGWRVRLLSDAGQPLVGWDSRGSQSRTEYDHQLRPTAQFEHGEGDAERCVERFQYAGSGPEEVERNACGRLIRHDDTAGSASWSGFDLHGQPLNETRRFLIEPTPPDWPESMDERDALLEEDSYTAQWRRDALGVELAQTDALGNVITQRYTVAGQLADSSLVLVHQTAEKILVRDIVYNAFGQVATQTSGNDVMSSATYDEASGRLVHLLARKSDQTLLQDLRYDYDPVGNVIRIDDRTVPTRYWRNQRIDGVSTYRYDTWHQLIEATGRESEGAVIGPSLPEPIPITPGGGDHSVLGNYTQIYRYDAGGNLTRLQHVGLRPYTRSMAVAPNSNRSLYQAEGEPVPDFEAGFDGNGNQRELQSGRSMRWNVRNQLSQVATVARNEEADDDEVYAYAGGHQRLRKLHTTKAQDITHYAEVRYLPGLEWRTNTATGEVLHVVKASAGRSSVRVLHWQAGGPSDIQNDQCRYQFDDHLGSVTLELDGNANLMSQEGYYPYGGTAWLAARSVIEVKYKTIRYSGKERDATGLYYYGFRYYAPWLCRWISTDPAGAMDGLNRYRMVMGNPATCCDWMGLYAWEEIASSAGAGFVRDATSSLISSSAKYVAQLGIHALMGTAVNVPLTIAGAFAGALSGGYVGAGLGAEAGNAMAGWFGDPGNTYAARIGAAIGGVAGAGMGAAPSIVGHFISGGVNTLAIEQVTNAIDAVTRETAQTIFIGAGPSVRWKNQPQLRGVAATAAGQAVALGAMGAAAAALPDWVGGIPIRAAGAGASQVVGTVVRAFSEGAEYSPHKQWLNQPGKLDIIHPAAISHSASSLLQMAGSGISQIPVSNPRTAAAMNESLGGFAEFRDVPANRVAEGVRKIHRGAMSIPSGNPASMERIVFSDTTLVLAPEQVEMAVFRMHATIPAVTRIREPANVRKQLQGVFHLNHNPQY